MRPDDRAAVTTPTVAAPALPPLPPLLPLQLAPPGAQPPPGLAPLEPLAPSLLSLVDLGIRKTDFVLLIDDQPMVGEAVRRIVAEMDGFDYHYVSEPETALATIADIQPTVVLLDLMMPGTDGLTVLAQIRADAALASLPVVMLSTTEAPDVKARAFAAGTDDYLVKIPDRVELQARLRYHSTAHKVRLQRDAAMQSLRESQRRLQALNLQLLHLSQVDGLTGLFNRRHYDETLDYELRRAERNALPLTLMLIDVDHFKRFNDLYGHQAGDRCLQAVAEVLRSKTKRAGEMASRYGGEEFGLVLPHCDADAAAALAEALLQAVRALAIEHTAAPTAHVTFSVGVVTKLQAGRLTPEQLTKLADDALYAAKHGGRDRCELRVI